MKKTTHRTLAMRIFSSIIYIGLIAAIPALFSSCKESSNSPSSTPSSTTAIVSGIVYGKTGTGTVLPLAGALVSVSNNFSSADTFTNAQGQYTFNVAFPDTIKAATTTTITATLSPNYPTQTEQVLIRPGSDITNANFTLVSTDTSTTNQNSGSAASIQFTSASHATANVQGVTGVQSVVYTFTVLDSSGVPVDANHKVKVYFKISPIIGGGEALTVDSTYTSIIPGLHGEAMTTLNTGIRSGIIQIQATTKSPLALHAVSTPLAIYGGPPSADHFTLSVSRINFPALNVNGLTDTVKVQVGDKWSNPVPKGTSVYFSSTTGVISPAGVTDTNGLANVTLSSGAPPPSGGTAWIYAQTVGDSGKGVKDSIQIVVSGTANVTPADTTLAIAHGNAVSLPFNVADLEFGHPLAGGTSISVSISGPAASAALTLSGNVNVTLPDTRSQSFTAFSATLKDTSTVASADRSFIVTINVSGPNGNVQRNYNGVLHGTGASTGGGTGAGTKTASIVLVSASPTVISVKGTGSVQTSGVTFLLLDRNGRPIAKDSATATFSLLGTNLGATLYPSTGQPDLQGQVQTVLSAGTISGVVQIVATVDTGTASNHLLVTSSPVPVTIASGLADSAHFSLAVATFNLPGRYRLGLTDVITAAVGDKYGNPVHAGTAVYFTTNGGLIKASGSTDSNGTATSILQTASPQPPKGMATITASTVDQRGITISQTANVLFTGNPVITPGVASLAIPAGGAQTFSFTVTDDYPLPTQNPLAAGTVVGVSLVGNAATQVALTGDVSTTLGDYLTGGHKRTSFTVNLADTVLYSLINQQISLVIGVSGPNGNASATIPVTLLKVAGRPIALIKKVTVVNITSRTLHVRGTGAPDTATQVTAEIEDGNGNALPMDSVLVNFNLSPLGAGSFVPGFAITNLNGQATTTFYSGIDTGAIQVTGQVGDIVSGPQNIVVGPGAASATYFTMTLIRPPDSTARLNFPGIAAGSQVQIGEILIHARDRYGNPVTPTQVSVTTTAGTIQGGGIKYTDLTGSASLAWFGGTPLPAGGFGKVTANIVGEKGVTLLDTISVTYSGAPILAFSPALASNYVFRSGIDTTITFTVADANGNPLAGGNIVTVTAVGTGGSSCILTGAVKDTLNDSRALSATKFSVHVRDTNTISTASRLIGLVLQVSGPNGNAILESDGTILGATHAYSVLSVVQSNPHIVVSGVGAQSSDTISVQLLDSLNNQINLANVPVAFSFTGLSGSFSAYQVLTNSFGQAKSIFFSSLQAETVMVSAQAGRVASPVLQVFVDPGPPSASFFTLSLLGTDGKPHVNFPGLVGQKNLIGNPSVLAKDNYGNLVKTSTPIFFATNAGVVPIVAYTNPSGTAQTSWLSGAPNPPLGIATVKGYALNAASAVIAADSQSVVYSGAPVIAGGLGANFILRHGIDTTFAFSVKDANGNPLSLGNQISVTLGGRGATYIQMLGNVSVTTPDTKDPSTAVYSLRLRDTNSTNSDPQAVSMTIAVSGPNGSASTANAGTIAGAPVPSVQGIFLVNAGSLTPITVNNAGGVSSLLLTFQLQDSLGNPIHKDSVTVAFSSQGAPGYFTPPSVKSDTNGQVQTVFHSDSTSGVVQLIAAFGSVISQNNKIVIVGGKPDPKAFSLIVTKPGGSVAAVNYPGEMPAFQQIGSVTVQLGDRYNNPVPPGTYVYFTSNAGVVQGSAQTGANGSATVQWFGENPNPPGGLAVIKASALGVNGVTIFDSTTVLYTGQALITGGLPANYVLKSDIDTTFTFSVKDANGNPLSAGATIQVTATGAGASSVILTGDVSVTMPDTKSLSAENFSVTLHDTNSTVIAARALTLNIVVAGPNGSATQQTQTTLSPFVPPVQVLPSVTGLALVTNTQPQLTVKNSGGISTSLLTFELRDSLNRAVHQSGVRVMFTRTGGLGAFVPDTALTDSNGQAHTAFNSDSTAGIVQIQAKILNSTIASGLFKITIVGGAPDPLHSTFVLSRPGSTTPFVNFPGGLQVIGQIGIAQFQAADRYSNPVPPGTPILFTTNAGVITGTASTDANGFAQVTWLGGNPVPANEVAVVKASAIGLNGQSFVDSAVVTYSGQAVIAGGPLSGFTIPGGQSSVYNYKISDALGNPIAAGDSVTVTATGTGGSVLVLTGNTSFVTKDTRDTNTTHYSFTAHDTTSVSQVVRPVQFAITVKGANGSASQTTNGSLAPTGGGRSSLPGAIALISTTPQNIQVTGTGGVETSTMIFEVQDSIGSPVDSAYRVRFSLQPPLGGAFVSPDSGLNDPTSGKITAVLHAGTASGVVQVVATVVSITGTISSTPVRVLIEAGQPDQAHFSIGARPLNIGGLVFNGVTDTVSVIVGDKYSNPVPQGTAIYFSTTEGIISTSSGFTNEFGQASAVLFSGNPRSANGFGYVYASTIGDNGTTIKDSVQILFSGAPIIDSVSISPNDLTPFTASFRVYDINHNPEPSGTTVTVATTGDVSLVVSQVFPTGTLPDVESSFWTKFSVNFSLKLSDSPLKLGPFTATINVNGPTGSAAATFNGVATESSVVITPTHSAGGVKTISMLSEGATTLTVKNDGGVETSALTFGIYDSTGTALARDSVKVYFRSTGVLGTVFPDSGITDATGKVSTIFASDTVAGLAVITAQVAGTGIVSAPVNITILGGNPSPTHTTILATTDTVKADQPLALVNFPGAASPTLFIGALRVRVGDKYGNIAAPGTPVYFTTNAGIISGSDYTNATGIAIGDWYGGQPVPANGLAVLTASLNGDNGLFSLTDTVVYSGLPHITLGLPSHFNLHAGIDTTFIFTVKDAEGMPIASGNVITPEVTGSPSLSAILSGSIGPILMPDTKDTSKETYHIRITDTNTVITTAREMLFTVGVVNSNGVTTAFDSVSGTIGGAPHSGGGGGGSTASVSGLVLANIATTQLSVNGGGGTQTSLLTYQLTDSLGNALAKSGVSMFFTVQPSAVWGSFTPDTITTGANGQAQTLFHSGTKAGVASVFATLTGGSITSSATNVVIAGGLPAPNNFTLLLERPSSNLANVNFPGAVANVQTIGTATVQVGDQYGNPVPSGTYVYFSSNAGVISSSAQTNAVGVASVSWSSGNPDPAGEIARVSASAFGSSGQFSVTDTVLYSGTAAITGGPTANFQISGDGAITFSYKVADALGNPLASGSVITVTATGTGAATVKLGGTTNYTTTDTKDTSATDFTATVTDTASASASVRSLGIVISVTGSNGNVSQTYSGSILPVGHTSSKKPLPGGIALLSNSSPNIQVSGTGGVETSTLIFQVRDSLGSSVDSGYVVNFMLQNAPAGTFLSPASATNDTSTGDVSVVIHSGTVSGVVQVIATIVTSPGDSVKSSPILMTVHSGSPDQRHFSLFPTALNVAGLEILNMTDQINVIVGDVYSNPVASATAVYFSTHAGVITPAGYTDADGQASVTLYSAQPLPDASNPDPVSGNGFLHVYAKTDGLNGAVVQDSVLVLFSGSPRISSADTASFDIPAGSCKSFNVTVADRYQNPLVSGTTIALSITSSNTATISPASYTMADELSPKNPSFPFTVCAPADTSGTPKSAGASITVTVTWQGGQYSATIASGTLEN